MPNKKETTPRSRIRSALRQLWLRSRERGIKISQAKYTCERCGVKQSKKKGFEQKVEVHHKKGIGNWDMVMDVVQKEILCSPDDLEVLCPECHKAEGEHVV
jgi:predicted HNH restriction endonuclease